jgi:hypothetical protein
LNDDISGHLSNDISGHLSDNISGHLSNNISGHLSEKIISIDPKNICGLLIEAHNLYVLTCTVLHEVNILVNQLSFSQD